jgi:uncharacterized protein (TIGR03083 family)
MRHADGMDREAYLRLLRSDGDLLASTAATNLGAAVPPCPGWTVEDVVTHTATVYEHKIECIRLGGQRPDPWPPDWPADRDPLAWFGDAHQRLLSILESVAPDAPSWTWFPADQTAGFWVRRMAQETAVHRVDVQSAGSGVTPVDADLAVDGIDEVLQMMLAGDWSDLPQPGSRADVTVEAGGRAWTVLISPEEIEVVDRAATTSAQISGESSDVVLWLWGRRPDAAVTTRGDAAHARVLRERLALATQ